MGMMDGSRTSGAGVDAGSEGSVSVAVDVTDAGSAAMGDGVGSTGAE